MPPTEANPIILYDLKSAPGAPQSWSPNPLKARIALNYKRLPHKTVWVPYPKIASTLKELGLGPLDTDVVWQQYTLPVIIDPTPSGTPKIVRESAAIALYLEATYPDPERSLFPNGSHALQMLFYEHFNTRVFPYLRLLLVPLVPDSVLAPGDDQEYFRKTRHEEIGYPLADLRPKGAELDKTWELLEKEFGVIDSFFQHNDVEKGGVGGPYMMGNKFSFADIIIVSAFLFMHYMKPIDRDGNAWERVRKWHGGRWERLWKASEEYFEIK